ncbi:hypothetical protein [Ornithinimicrobium cerasi]|uniref:hypothetical protein n=1 Tax=Ornithinimicrobium cerasi TaxID=2248773 RepID=UPI000EFEC150|nr:hypothetical protein [Ornithinimicrobium cerasi]
MTDDTSQPGSTPFTDDEHELIRRSAFGAIALVSRSDPGFFSMFKESMAGSKALQEAPEGVKALLSEGGFPTPPAGSPEEVEETLLADLGQTMRVLRAKAPTQAQAYRDVILAASDRVAAASDGVAAEEQQMIEKIRAALSDGIAGDPPVGDTAVDAPRHG